MAEKIKVNCPENELFAAAVRIVEKVRNAGFEIFFVGGAVRDLVLGNTPADIDMVTTALPQEICQLFPGAEMVGACFGVVLIKQDGFVFETATCREERLYSDGRRPDEVKFTKDVKLDLARRDFTVNAMLYDPVAEEVIDYVGGLQDIKKRLLRVVGVPEERFSEDYLRMLRAIRFAAKLRFDIDDSAWKAICSMAGLCGQIAAERVRDELENMLCNIDAARALQLLKASGILRIWLPEVDALAGVEQHPKYHPEGDVWVHTLLMFEKAAVVKDRILAWSILLHDIGKKPAFSVGSDNIPHFYGHEAMGADMVPAIAQRLRFSGEYALAVEHAVRYHLRFASVMDMREAKLKRL
ncbi:MAG: CCA tRNA nucleotidyltransferase, partial [Lentisphaeria bacterium]|nr:CCA tRNA nucleotidyltransferase [Lentisphaeria bacterium]